MKKQTLSALAALLLATCASIGTAHANTSYLLIQGPFGTSGAEETFKWQFSYTGTALSSGQDLLNSVFGVPVDTGVSSDPDFPGYTVATAGNSETGATYIDFGGSYLVYAFTLDGVTVDTNDTEPAGTSTQGWNYYAAGGGGYDGPNAYQNNGTWQFAADDGTASREVGDGTFDGWVFGDTGSDVDYNPAGDVGTIDTGGGANNPTVPDFSSATLLSVPEPSLALPAAGAALLFAFGLRKRKP